MSDKCCRFCCQHWGRADTHHHRQACTQGEQGSVHSIDSIQSKFGRYLTQADVEILSTKQQNSGPWISSSLKTIATLRPTLPTISSRWGIVWTLPTVVLPGWPWPC